MGALRSHVNIFLLMIVFFCDDNNQQFHILVYVRVPSEEFENRLYNINCE